MNAHHLAAVIMGMSLMGALSAQPTGEAASAEIPATPVQQEITNERLDVVTEPMEGKPSREGLPVSPLQEKLEREIDSDLFLSLDRDKSGTVTQGEGFRNEQLSRRFDEFDRNGDRQLDRTEFSVFEQSLR